MPDDEAGRWIDTAMSKDPVCGMSVESNSPLNSTHSGQTYVFCSAACKSKFDNDPGRYAPAPEAQASRGGKS